ncbi:hypothetical protein AM587_10017017 [Phytophthora nicotianae]|uniref:Uncharacterized protein n=1 Tax=Phytophthora nicotianae TaxID=4792 RepID=A0A0W8D169_PHYNI|nr:hypothetical protein AM587_10017017 [Phytophthora nicotianae]
MNEGCTATVLEHELAAFALPAGLDCPPQPRIDFRLDAGLDALDVELSAAVLVEVEPAYGCAPATPSYNSTGSSHSSSTTPSRKLNDSRNSLMSVSPKPHRHHSKKASRKQVHELQAMVNVMQAQVDSAAAEIQQLAQLVGQFAEQREQEKEEYERVRRREQQLFAEHEMDMDLDVQQRHLRAQVQRDREQFEREQLQQQCFDCPSAPPPPEQETFRF